MADDDLSAPLGQNAKKKRRRFELPIRAAAWRSPALLGAVRAVSARSGPLMVDDPLGGEPIAVVGDRSATRQAAGTEAGGRRPRSAPKLRAATTGRAPARRSRRRARRQPRRPARKTVTIIDGSTGKRQEVPIPAAARPIAAARRSSSSLLETSRHGADPEHRARRRAAGRVYARAGQAARRQARTGRGSRSSSAGSASAPTPHRQAIEKLPAPVTLRVRALRRRPRAAGDAARAPRATRCCCRRRWSRSTIPTTIPARRRC